jgi:hypothetical protein
MRAATLVEVLTNSRIDIKVRAAEAWLRIRWTDFTDHHIGRRGTPRACRMSSTHRSSGLLSTAGS